MNKERFITIFRDFGLTEAWAEISWRNHEDTLAKIDESLAAWDHQVMSIAEGWERYSELGWK